MLDQQVGQRAVVDVRAGDYAGRRERLFVAAAVHDQRRPFGDLGSILGVLHAVIAVVADIALKRLRKKATLSLPHTKLMCGQGWMKLRGSGIAPF